MQTNQEKRKHFKGLSVTKIHEHTDVTWALIFILCAALISLWCRYDPWIKILPENKINHHFIWKLNIMRIISFFSFLKFCSLKSSAEKQFWKFKPNKWIWQLRTKKGNKGCWSWENKSDTVGKLLSTLFYENFKVQLQVLQIWQQF